MTSKQYGGSELNLRQEKFCQLISEGTISATEAYKQVYGENLSDNSAAASASKLLKNHKIFMRIRELRDQAASVKIKTVAQTKALLSDLLDDPDTAGGTKVAAARLLLQSEGALKPENAQTVNLYSDSEKAEIVLPKILDERYCQVDYDGPIPPVEYIVIE